MPRLPKMYVHCVHTYFFLLYIFCTFFFFFFCSLFLFFFNFFGTRHARVIKCTKHVHLNERYIQAEHDTRTSQYGNVQAKYETRTSQYGKYASGTRSTNESIRTMYTRNDTRFICGQCTNRTRYTLAGVIT